MKECPQCHNMAQDSDKFCKTCGMPLADVQPLPAEQTVSPATDEQTAAPAVEEQTAVPVPAADKKRPPRNKLPFIIAAAAVVLLGVVGIAVKSNTSDKPKEVIEIPAEDAIASLEKIYASRKFDDKLDMSQHPGLVSAEDVTGPFLEIRKGDSFYVPDSVKDSNAGKGDLPSDAEIVVAQKDSFPKEYKQLLQTGKNVKKAAKGKEPVVYGLMEYTGYGVAGKYNNGGFMLYYHTSRVSFYDLESNEMLGWVNTTDSRSGPFILYTNQYGSDGQHPILYYKGDSIWSDIAWTKGLDELFYDENGYQVVGDVLKSVPEDVDTIEIPETVKEIAGSVGTGHKAKKLIIPDSVERIGASAFSGSSLKEITVPNSVKYCEGIVFNNTPWMEKQAKEDWVIIGDGVLIKCNSSDEELVIPDDVHYLVPGAFAETQCKKVTIPKSVEQCCANTSNTSSPFNNLDTLEELVIQGGLEEKIEDVPISVAAYCQNLKKITIDCKMDELEDTWLRLNSDTLKNLEMICPDDSPAAKWAEKNNVSHKEK